MWFAKLGGGTCGTFRPLANPRKTAQFDVEGSKLVNTTGRRKVHSYLLFWVTLLLSVGLAKVALAKADESFLFVSTNATWPAFISMGLYAQSELSPIVRSSRAIFFSDESNPELDPYINFKASSPVAAAIGKEILKTVGDESANTTLFFMTHGWRDLLNAHSPATRDVRMYVEKGRGLYFSNLSREIQKIKPKEKYLRYYSSVCYGNGAHKIAIENENTCGLGLGDFEIFFPSGWISKKAKKTVPEYWLKTTIEPNQKRLIENMSAARTYDMDGTGDISLLDQYLVFTAYADGSFAQSDRPEIVNPRFLPWSASLSSMAYAQVLLGKSDFYNEFNYPHSKNHLLIRARLQEFSKKLGHPNPSIFDLNSEWLILQRDLRMFFTYYNDPQVVEALKALPAPYQAAFQALFSSAEPNIRSAWKRSETRFSKMMNSINLVQDRLQLLADCRDRLRPCSTGTLQSVIKVVLADLDSDLKHIIENETFFMNRGRMLERFLLLGHGLRQATVSERQKLLSLMHCELQTLPTRR